MQDKPFVLLGVNINCYEPKKLKEVMVKEQLNFRSFTDRREGDGLGVISSAWNLMGTPTVFVIDHKGVIRYVQRGIPDRKAIDELVSSLVKEVGRNGK